MRNTLGAQRLLVDLADRMLPWPATEKALACELPGDEVYLGGDGLRPYACWTVGDSVNVMGLQPAAIPPPPLIEAVLGGAYGAADVRHDLDDPRLFSATVPRGDALVQRIDPAQVLLIGLADSERYRGARLPLGVARLSQWLRFTHAACVTVVDYNFTPDPLQGVARLLEQQAFDIVGVSVNFGQWTMLEDLALVVNEHQPRLVVLGNILAAFSPDAAVALFDVARDGSAFVATSLGERPLEAMCRHRRDPEAVVETPGLIRPGGELRLTVQPSIEVEPPDLVFPDDSLVVEVAERGGQIALETSFGCQYGACTFCPRDHRGHGWSRGERSTMVAILERVAATGSALSIVDEEFFGADGLIDPPMPDLPAADILAACRRLGISYEIYTRLQQLFDRRRSRAWNLERARLLATEARSMRRLFVGVESGSPSQLRRYGKGQTVAQTADALRVGSLLSLPMEFGFITFDPLLTPDELAENIEFLAREDVMVPPCTSPDVDARVETVARFLDGVDLTTSGVPLYQHVAYMATELEVLAHSRYADHLRRRHPELLDGAFDPSFARHGVRYRDARIGEIAGWSRVWTEGMFVPVYEARMAARASDDPTVAQEANRLVARYRHATFGLLLGLATRLLPDVATRLDALLARHAIPSGDDPEEWLADLASATLPGRRVTDFDVRLRSQRRER